MSRRTWAAVLATAALATAPVGSAAGTAPAPQEMTVRTPWVVQPAGAVEVRLGLDVDEPDRFDVDVTVDGVPADHGLRFVENGLEGEVRVPEGSSCGPAELRATARWSYAGGKFVETEDYRGTTWVLCPRLSVTPDRVAAASPGTPLVWEATGFVPDSVVALRLGDQPVQVVETDKRGSVRYTAPSPQLPCGVVPARAADVLSPQARSEREIPADLVVEALDRIRVDCPDRPQPEPAPPALVQVSPAVVPVGTTTRVSGEQFPPGSAVALSWLLPGGRTLPAGAATADAAGSVRADVLVLVNSGTGPRQLLAGAGAAAASDQVLVVAGTTQPGRHGLVNRR